jgi:uncharacterized membrane protein required for colicin V production
MFMAALPVVGGLSFNYVDGAVAVWLIVGLVRGRKRGMTQELLPMLHWLAIVVLAGLFYAPLSDLIFKNTGGAFSHLWANITAYVLIAFAIHLFFLWLKQTFGDKLTGSDYFGRAEYYLGMAAGMVRFACLYIVFCAIMHARVYTAAEVAELDKAQKRSIDNNLFPTYPSVQHAILAESFTGQLLETNLSRVLIVSSTKSKTPAAETPAKKREDQINAIIGAPKK